MEGRFLIWKLDFYVRRDVRLAAQEERYQARFSTVVFLTNRIVAWLTAVVKQLQAPRVCVPRPRRAVDTQVIFEFESALIYRVVQRILLS